MRALVRDADAADFTVRLTDEVPRIPVAATAARRFFELVDHADLRGFGWLDRFMLHVGARLARGPAAPRDAARRAPASRGVGRRRPAGRRPGVRPATSRNGAPRRAAQREHPRRGDRRRRRGPSAGSMPVLARLRRPDVDYVSVKISAICAGISTLAFEHTVDRIADRAARALRRRGMRATRPMFVNLDMEEYRDLDLTVAAFRHGARRARVRASRCRHRAPGVPSRLHAVAR